MNLPIIYTVKALRKLYALAMNVLPPLPRPICEQDPEKASEIINTYLMDDKPCMIARFGSTELNMLVNYLGICQKDTNIFKYIKGESLPWWWEKNRMRQMQNWSGFFPPTEEKIEQFCQLMLNDIPQVDVLGSWLPDECFFQKYSENANKVHLRFLEPWWSKTPWTKQLAGKKVLVVHPFADLIQKQYNTKHNLLFQNKNILPEFNLDVIPAVQSLGGNNSDFKDWFQALNWMKSEINRRDYDICLIGCGAYGFPLAAHVKRQGKQAIHLGGVLQLLFGITGKRWEDINYGVKEWNIEKGFYNNLMNQYWVRPSGIYKPQNAKEVEDACYW